MGILLPLAVAGGCASSARDIGAAAAPAVVRSALHEANARDDQQQIQHLADSPAFQHAGRAVGEGVGIGLFNQVNQFAGGGTPVAASQPTTMPGGNPGARAVAELTGVGLNGFVKSSVQDAFLAATDPQFKAGEEAMSEAIGEGFVSGTIKALNQKGPELAETLGKQLGPIIQELIREQIAPAVREMLQQQIAPAALQIWRDGAVETLKLSVRPDLQQDVQQNAQNASIGAARGTNQILVENRVLSTTGELNPHLKLYGTLLTGGVVLILITLITLLLLLNLIALQLLRRQRKPTR
jgi:hypothetical protein